MSAFNPPPILRNCHVQTLISSTPLRAWPLARRTRQLQADAEDVILECSDGIRLHGLYNANPEPSRGLAILLHGWEGDAQSSYQLSNAHTLYQAGFSVFRLHLRDHGPSHALNPELYNSTRLREVIDAVGEILHRYPHHRHYMAGHSLGGNFTLRVAARAPEFGIHLDKVVGVCPVLDPWRTMQAIEAGSPIYHRYFVHRWKRSLKIKLEHYPELGYGDTLLELQTLGDMNDYFVPHYTDYADSRSYYHAYALTGDTLRNLQIPAHIILSQDDPMIPCDDLEDLARSDNLSIETPRYGGHCGFLMNWQLDGWIDQRLLHLFQ
ncbi:alpha/beta hydrolase [Halioglobus japonicus]|uniref:Alpha/beta hydrolase n=1 Tax=Halioglobus japonicus TaxID=930805 RepID=A0AAP8SN91_9GAMM|nr:alpha/beta fold hydrolase [Halioglobus japonicus]AQA18384.1 alpha/beta hydrolase [Halioglobus japonicus]PLW86400.1 alpha/beta hydrolase [Halioglobus japonicus]GHD13072.1 alpha/beta hydrolase [Halioglobus japonicus]